MPVQETCTGASPSAHRHASDALSSPLLLFRNPQALLRLRMRSAHFGEKHRGAPDSTADRLILFYDAHNRGRWQPWMQSKSRVLRERAGSERAPLS